MPTLNLKSDVALSDLGILTDDDSPMIHTNDKMPEIFCEAEIAK